MKKNMLMTITLVGVIALTCTNAAAWTSRQGRPVHDRDDHFELGQSRLRAWDMERRNGDRKMHTMPLREQTWETVASGARNPREVCSAVKSRVKYMRDSRPEDQWKHARNTWDDRSGDCEDFAVLVKRLCNKANMNAEVYRFYPPEGCGHAVTIGAWNGRMWMSSNGSIVEVKSIDDAKRRVETSQGWPAGSVRSSKGEKAGDAVAAW